MPDQVIHLIDVITEFMAVTATGGNALRNQERGVVGGIQSKLREVTLKTVPVDSVHAYGQWLDAATESILGSLQAEIPPWGTVRKAMNLFMRACICDHALRAEYGLDRLEPWAEIPLDSVVADALRLQAGRDQLPAWPGLKHLDRPTNEEFQTSAVGYAKQLGLPARIYLDYHLWLRNR